MLPVVALVGRPHVGKSTLFHVLTRSRDALVADQPGVTRDRHYGVCRSGDAPFVVVDTGGLVEGADAIAALTARQVDVAIGEADVVVFVVDARDGLLPTDQAILAQLRRADKPVVLAVNKVDGLDESVAMADFAKLGLADALPLSAAHGRGVLALLAALAPLLPAPGEDAVEQGAEHGIRVAIIGRPNVGKSTLFGRLVGGRPALVHGTAGLTRGRR